MPPMAPLPKNRVSKSTPFTFVGLDYFGPLYIKEKSPTGTTSTKVWICLFTCMAVRAVHLEMVTDMTAEQFLLCFRRFIARRGTPALILSDNATQFKLAKTVVEKAWENVLRSPDVKNYTANKGIQWKFIVQLAPWMGVSTNA